VNRQVAGLAIRARARGKWVVAFSLENGSTPDRNDDMTKHDPKLTLTVRSTSGSFSDTWNTNNKAQKVYDDALRKLSLPAGQYVLKLARTGAVLELSEKLGDLGLEDGDVLVLQAAQPQDG
jgi:hypothetical protein